MMWHGQGWHMKSDSICQGWHMKSGPLLGQQLRMFYDVTFDDAQQAVIFALKYA
jgi:hypothetical protein